MKLKDLINRIPRPLKACVCTVLVIVLAVVYYIALGCPTLTFQQEFRRAEKVHLVGPSKIVDKLHNGIYRDFDKMIVGETEYGISFFGRYYNHYPYNDPFAEKQYLFTYLEKTGDITFAAAPNVWGWAWDYAGMSLPVYIFTDHTDAVRAEIEISVSGVSSSCTVRNETFQCEANQTDPGVFRFILTSGSESESDALSLLSSVSTNNMRGGVKEAVIPILVRLYDANDKLITEKELTLRFD